MRAPISLILLHFVTIAFGVTAVAVYDGTALLLGVLMGLAAASAMTGCIYLAWRLATKNKGM